MLSDVDWMLLEWHNDNVDATEVLGDVVGGAFQRLERGELRSGAGVHFFAVPEWR